MSLANSCALLLFFLTLSLYTTFSTAANTIGVTHTTVAVAADNVPFPKKVATFLPSDISPPTEKYWYSRLPNTPLPKALEYLLQPGHYPSITREFANENVSAAVIQRIYRRVYKRHYKRGDKKSLKSALPDSTIFYQYNDLHPDTEVDEVPLVGADGTRVKAVTVCHLNTKAKKRWDPSAELLDSSRIYPHA
ncbi:hypothetical protein D5086_032701 [Populus alba]|uniref:Uncharacterized protein n=1 Tax=Populus alba TaxID=43335 RepID=A0ACC4AER9_POPAL